MVSLRALSATKDLVEVGGGFTHSFALSAAPPRPLRSAPRSALTGSIILRQVDDVFEDRVDLGADVLRMQQPAPAVSRLGLGFCGYTSSTNLGAERGGGADLCLHVWPGYTGSDRGRSPASSWPCPLLFADLADLPDLDAPQHDLGVGLQYQGPPRSDARVTGTYDLNVPAKAVVVTNRNTATCRQQDQRPPTRWGCGVLRTCGSCR